MKLESLKNKALPSLAAFEDKKITAGLKFILGGAAYTATEGGSEYHECADGTVVSFDYVADAILESGETRLGRCSEHSSAQAFFTHISAL